MSSDANDPDVSTLPAASTSDAVPAPRPAWRAADAIALVLAVLAAVGAKAGWLPELPW